MRGTAAVCIARTLASSGRLPLGHWLGEDRQGHGIWGQGGSFLATRVGRDLTKPHPSRHVALVWSGSTSVSDWYERTHAGRRARCPGAAVAGALFCALGSGLSPTCRWSCPLPCNKDHKALPCRGQTVGSSLFYSPYSSKPIESSPRNSQRAVLGDSLS